MICDQFDELSLVLPGRYRTKAAGEVPCHRPACEIRLFAATYFIFLFCLFHVRGIYRRAVFVGAVSTIAGTHTHAARMRAPQLQRRLLFFLQSAWYL